MSKIIGIDLGTTNSVVSVMEGGEPKVIPTAEGGNLCPSVVAVNPKTHERLVGQLARRQAITNPENTIFSIKRLMGRKFSDAEVQKALKVLPYKIIERQNGDAWVLMDGKEYSPPEISAMILAKLKSDAEAYLGEKVTQAVITVPAYFNDAQRQATKDAGRIAGLDVLRIINEPTASALAYGMDKKKDEKIAVYDLGGDDLDERIIDWIIDEYRKDQGIDLHNDRMALQRLKEAAEKTKIELSTTQQSEINLPFITADASGPKHLNMTLTRSKLEQLVSDLIDRSMAPVKQALSDAGFSASDINEVLLVGGQTRMPLVQKRVEEFFKKAPNKGINPDEVVAVGAAIQAGVLGGQVDDVLLLDVTPLTLGIETLGGVATPLIERNTTIPTRKSQIFSTASDMQTQVQINVVQGERPMANDNKQLGTFSLDGIPAAPRGVPQIEVTFDIDADGILHVSAKDKATGREQQITITASSGLNKEEIDRMVKSAEEHAADDKRRRDEAEARNETDSLAYSAEKTLKDLGDKVPADVRSDVEAKIAAAREAVKGSDTEEMRRRGQELSAVLQQVAAAAYQQPGDQTPPPGNDAQQPGDDEQTVEGDFREV